jgi:hypothetical protein
LGSGSRRVYAFTVCIRDDDNKTFELRTTSGSTELATRVTAAIANGRHVRCYVLAGEPDAQAREERFLAGKGNKRGTVQV